MGSSVDEAWKEFYQVKEVRHEGPPVVWFYGNRIPRKDRSQRQEGAEWLPGEWVGKGGVGEVIA